MKRKLIKYGILSIVVVLIGWNLSQCIGGNPGNMRQYEIINKIKEKMKAEMDRIDFEVNFDDYEFKVKPLQSFGDYGSVTIKDKRYNYDPIKIYDGSLQQLEQEKIGVNPIIFVYDGYIQYLNEKSKDVKSALENHLKSLGVDYEEMKFRKRDFTGTAVYPFSLEIINGVPEKNDIDESEIFLWEKESKIAVSEYLNYYQNKKNSNFDYNQYDLFMSKGVLYFYKIKGNQNVIELENQIKALIKNDRIFIQLNN